MKPTPQEVAELHKVIDAVDALKRVLDQASPAVRDVFFKLLGEAVLRDRNASAENSAPDKNPRLRKEYRVPSTTRRRDFVRVVR
jgi:hypothetical protein